MDTFFDKLSNTLFQKLLNETEKINQKIDNLESKVEEQKIQFGKTFSTLNNQVALILENTRKINKQISFQNEAKTEIKNVKIDLSSLKIDESPLDYINSHLEYKLVAQFGGPNGTIFIIAVKVNGKLYFGLDSSKKKARISAAENVFQDLKNQFNKISVNSENTEIENTVTNTEINLNVLSSNEKPLEYLKKKLLYSLVETVGPAHKPTFKMAVKVNGKIYHGFGNSKEKAKINTAENVFQTLKNQFNNISVNSKNKELEESTLANTEIDLNVLSSNEKPLEYLKRNLVYSLVETLGPEHQATFKMAVKVNGRMYYGFGNSKEKAKINTAENVFQTLRNQFNKILVNSKIEELESTIANIEINVNELNSNERPLEYLKRNLVYSLVETAGPAHQPTFKMAVKVNGKIYYGFGNSKEKAKINTTENVFLSLKKQFNNISVNPENKELEESPIANTEINLNVLSSNEKPLEYLKRNLVYSLVETVGPAHQPTFKMAVKVNGKMYYGLGNSKEKARINAAENVFQSLKKQFKDVSVMPNNDLVDIEISPNLLILKKHPLEYVRSVLKYSLVETVGPKNRPTFKMAVKVNGKVYFREDNTKTKARCSVAEEVFKDLVIKPYLDKTNSRQNQNQQKDDLVNELKSTEAVLESIGNNFPQPQKFLNQLYPNLVCYRVESQTDDEFEDEESDETVVEEKDIEIVMLQTNASRTRAIEALKKSGNNIINAIMNLTSR